MEVVERELLQDWFIIMDEPHPEGTHRGTVTASQRQTALARFQRNVAIFLDFHESHMHYRSTQSHVFDWIIQSHIRRYSS
jgi:hypothetical protein